MGERIHALAQVLFGKSSVEECSLEEIRLLVKRYPYFAPAQFLLLQKVKSENAPDYDTQQRKAVLYYHDPLQFDFFVSPEKFFVDEESLQPKNATAAAGVTGTEEPVAVHTADESTKAAESILSDPETTANASNAAEPAKEVSAESFPAEHTADLVPAPAGHRAMLETGRLPENQTAISQTDLSLDKQELEKTAVEENFPKDVTDDLPGTPSNAEDTATEQKTQEPETNRHSEENATVAATEPLPEDNQQANAPPSSTGGSLAFEPYHTVDYFASQGIKVLADELPKDRLGKQLRSFTEWLKMMKRLPASELSKSAESAAEKNVESLASHSVMGSDVVTEAMAEVWVKQGASEKAIETYNKLSLLNPSKKAYFAAKIENLKQS